MAKKTENFITIPKDFQSLHDLKDLVDNYEVLSKLANALNGYQKLYVDSYLKTFYELKTYLPKGSEDVYQVWDEPYKKSQYYKMPLKKFETRISEEDKDKKLFLVDTKNKVIQIFGNCDALNTSYFKDSYPKFDKIKYEVDLTKRKLLVTYNFSFTDSYPVGGCKIWCGTGHSYLTGHTNVDYIRNGYDIHEFCTRTNKYLGCKKRVLDKGRTWVKT